MNKRFSLIVLFIVMTLFFVWLQMPKEVFIVNSCDITKENCSFNKDGINVKFSTGAKKISANKPLTYKLKIDGLEDPSVKLFLFGESMVMNAETIELEKIGPNEYKATRDFPICTEKKMTWRLHLSAKDSKKLLKTNFNFEVFREN